MAGLRLANNLVLPLEVAGEAIALLAKRGAGKTNTGIVLAEEMLDAKVQVVALDPVGAWWGLRSKYEIPILGGLHADVPLEPTAGVLIADVIVETGTSMVVDLSDFATKADVARFVRDFLDRLYRRLGREPRALHVFLEEADEFAPQKPFKEETRMLSAVEQVVRRGRARGLGMTLITQRSAVLNKNVLEQTDVLIAMRTTGPNDRKAIEGWIGKHEATGNAPFEVGELGHLQTGDAWVWNPERDLLERVHVRARKTLDVSGRIKPGAAAAGDAKLKSFDASALGDEIQATVERVKANDPAELRKQIRSLERQVAEAAKAPAAVETIEVPYEVPVLQGEQISMLNLAVEEIQARAKDFRGYADYLEEAVRPIVDGIAKITGARVPVTAEGDRPPARPVPHRASASQPARTPATRTGASPSAAPPASNDGDLTGPDRRVLDAIAWFAGLGIPQPTKQMAGLVAGYRVKKVGGNFGNILGRLHSGGYVTYPSPGQVTLTHLGEQHASDPGIEPTNDGLQAAVFERLSAPEQRVLRELIAIHPEAIDKIELAHSVGYQVEKVGGNYGNILGKLRSLGLIDYPRPGEAVAADVLFPEQHAHAYV